MQGIAIIDGFLAELVASPQYAEALDGDPVWAERLDDMEKGLRQIWRLGQHDIRAIDFIDEACRIIQSGDRMKLRLLGIVEILTRASQTFDPAAWGETLVAAGRS